MASAFLETNPSSAEILFDRGLCNLLLKHYSNALSDLRATAMMTSDPERFVFAGWAAKRAGDESAAIHLWKIALTLRQAYLPAVAALRKTQ